MNPLVTVILLPLLLGTGLCVLLGRFGDGVGRALLGPAWRFAPAWVAAAVTAAALVLLLQEAPGVLQGQVLLFHADWVPTIGLNLGFRLDGLSLLFGGMITGIGLLIVLYAAFYLSPTDSLVKFYCLLLVFMAAMLGIALSDNLLLLVVFWEMTSITSFLLVGFWGEKAEASEGARMALAMTGGGGLALLAGVILLGQMCGSYDLSQMFIGGPSLRQAVLSDTRYPAALILILIGCFTKSAQLPFHFWLPQAMAAPTPASAYLHSATMVKAGLFLLARLYPVIGGEGLFELIVTPVGLLTMAFGAFVAIFKHDMKGLLAYSTISHLGFITFLIGLRSPMSAAVAMFHILNHASFKAALFMTAGIVDHETGTRDMRRLGGLMQVMPWVGSLGLLASAAMAGLPPFNGFLSKELMFEQALHAGIGGNFAWTIALIANLAGLCSVAYSLRLVYDVFFNGPSRDLPQPHPHEPPWGMKLPVLILVLVCLGVGLFPMQTVGPLLQSAAAAMLGEPLAPLHLALWHGFNVPLLMSLVAVLGGVVLYFWLQRGGRLHAYLPRSVGGKQVFDAGMAGLLAMAGGLTRRFESGSLQRYLATLLVSALVLGCWAFWPGGVSWPFSPSAITRPLLPAPPLAVALWLLLMALGAVLLRLQAQRYVAVVLCGGIGLMGSLVFLSLSAPDLALTQLTVDVVSTVMLLMGLGLLPQTTPPLTKAMRRGGPPWRAAALALACGAGVTAISWAVLSSQHESLSWYFLAQSLPGGGGSNVVNVILVDFRGYDTFGEITVLGIAALGVLAVLDGMRAKRPAGDAGGRRWRFRQEPLLLQRVARWVLPLALLLSAHIFWRGHNQPGGGFIAGLITAAALILQYMALGQQRAEALLHARSGGRYVRWLGLGLGIASLTGIASFLFGQPFLTSAHGHPSVPGLEFLGEIPLASAAAFDLGVYIMVVGATMLMLSSFAHASKGGEGASC
ncbi:monovalent cation/H+ antiporter subunit A [Roseateles koreensis]|uniref:Monovalent cation/H+ antiporter subunit A n=1 Tax=Roseateles koreensis TaxID=2987526 RepID=A0ABT5KVK6_9BURK|nr:monovalent cation/H+ antiporter subunit A [Roseateles koreensis]MDC8786978.1 monovalent cation/H+ antiporter subunit A [Roseateles koreensis]